MQTIEREEGHKSVPNGVGDFDLICPTNGKVRFLPYMLACAPTQCSCGQKLEWADRSKPAN